MKFTRACTAGALGLALTLTGCSATGSGNPSTKSDDGAKLNVVVGLYPYQFLAEGVGGDLVDVENLTQPGAEPHDLELTAQQVADVSRADLVIYEKTLQPAVDDAVTETSPAHTLEVTTVVPLKEHALEDGSGSEVDPHIWLDPTLMVTVAEAIRDQFIALDQAGADAYTANAKALTDKLTALDQSFTDGLTTCERVDFITTHAAFGYLADRYALTQIPISGMSPDAEPSPDRMAEIQDTATKLGLTTVFFETLASPAIAQTIADDLGLKTDVLDPIEGVTAQSRGSDYIEIMQANLTALEQANGCQAA